MLSLNRKTEYALVSLCYLEQQRQAGESIVSTQKIAEAFSLPLPLLMNILKDLRKAGFVRSTRGASGGYSLNRDACQIVLLEVLEVMEGPMQLTPCSAAPPNLEEVGIKVEADCGLVGTCPVHQAINRLHNRIENFLRDVSLADLVHSSVDVTIDAVSASRCFNKQVSVIKNNHPLLKGVTGNVH